MEYIAMFRALNPVTIAGRVIVIVIVVVVDTGWAWILDGQSIRIQEQFVCYISERYIWKDMEIGCL